MLLALNLVTMWWFMARVHRRLDTTGNDAMRARIHSEHARDSAGRLLVRTYPGEFEQDRRYREDPPYLHTIPENKPPWYFDDKTDYRLLNEERP